MKKIKAIESSVEDIKLINQVKVGGVKHNISTEADYVFDRSGRTQEDINRKVESKVDSLDVFVKQQFEIKEYGVEIDFENDTFKRLGDASSFAMDLTAQSATNPFDNISPWKGMQRCVFTDDKKVLAYYGDSGYEEDGATGQCMVEIPRFYYKVVPLKLQANSNGSHGNEVLKIQYWICNYEKQGYKLHPCFYNVRGNEIPFLYFSAFEGCVWNKTTGLYNLADENWTLNTDKLSSIKDAKPCSGNGSNQLHVENTRKLSNNRGDGWEQQDFTSVSAIQLLLLVEYANTDSQGKVGQGVITLASGAGNESLITGQTSVLGNKSGMKTGETNGKCSVSYRGIENFWGNIWKFVDGFNIEAKGLNLGWISDKNGGYINNKRDGQSASIHICKSNGYANKIGYIENTDYAFLPTGATGSSSKPMNDYLYQNNTYNGFLIALLGGSWHSGAAAGCFFWTLNAAASSRGRDVGARLVCR